MAAIKRRSRVLVIKTFEELSDFVAAHGDVYTFSAKILRNMYPSTKLKINVRFGIAERLSQVGLKHEPSFIPDNQDAYVRLYREGSRVAEIIEACQNVSPDFDKVLRVCAAEDSSKELIDKIKGLVEDYEG